MNSSKRREIAQEAKRFAEAFRLADAYAKAGDKMMAAYFRNSIAIKRCKYDPAEAASIMEAARKRIQELLARDHERQLQGLPPPENKKPQFH